MAWPETLHLLRPEWLWALLPGLLLTLLVWRQRRQSGGWEQVIDPELLPELLETPAATGQHRWPWLVLLAWVLGTLAAAGPSFRQLPQPVEQPTDALVLLLDLSYSMKSTDLAPSRIDRSRQKLIDLLQRRSAGQTALVAFAGDAHVVTPLTDDHRTIANLLPALNPDMMPLPGSDAVAAVQKGLSLLQSAGIPRGHLILVSDGVEIAQAREIQALLAEGGSRLSVLAVGTPEGAPLPLPRGGFLRDRAGDIVIPGVDTAPLRSLARGAGGRFSEMRVDDSDLDHLLSAGLFSAGPDTRSTSLHADAWEDQGYWLILLLLPLTAALFRRGWLLALLPAIPLLLPAPPAQAQAPPSPVPREQTLQQPAETETRTATDAWRNLWLRPDQQGMRALQSEQPERAAELFEDPAWRGTARYRTGDYQAAAEAFAQQDNADAWYNRGNALARAGELEAAAEAYRESLQRGPDSPDAQANLSLVEELIEEQKKQQEQQQNEGEPGDPAQPDDNSSDSSGDAGEGGGDSQSGSPGQSAGSDAPGEPSAPEQSSGGSDPSEQSNEIRDNPWSAAEEKQAAAADADDEAADDAPPLPRFTPEEAERRQALEQWLRRVPDDPSGLLREKFRHESRQQQPARERNEDVPYW